MNQWTNNPLELPNITLLQSQMLHAQAKYCTGERIFQAKQSSSPTKVIIFENRATGNSFFDNMFCTVISPFDNINEKSFLIDVMIEAQKRHSNIFSFPIPLVLSNAKALTVEGLFGIGFKSSCRIVLHRNFCNTLNLSETNNDDSSCSSTSITPS